MQALHPLSARRAVGLFLAVALASATGLHASPRRAPLLISLVDQLPPQGNAPSFQGLDERRRGPLFGEVLREISVEGKLPPLEIINRDLSLPATVADEPPVAPGTPLVRIYLTQWSQTPLGGIADTEILCRFFVERRLGGRLEKKLGPFFARKSFNTVAAATPQERWSQYQAVAKLAVGKMAAVLAAHP